MKEKKFLLIIASLLSVVSIKSFALGPVDGEIGIALWENDFKADISSAEVDAGSLFIYGETWVGEKWGIRGAWFDSDLESTEFSNQSRYQLEVRRRLLSASDNTFLALGAGLEKIDLENGSDSSGFRISTEGRLSFTGIIFLYGKYAWVPSMGDAGNFDDISATEIDVGIHITPLPFVSLRLGYLEYDLDYNLTAPGLAGGSDSSGFYLGGGFHW